MSFQCLKVASLVAILAIGSCKEKSPVRQDSEGAASTVKTEVRPTFDHDPWNRLLREFVDEQGLVDYAGISRSKAFRDYVEQLARIDASGLKNSKERLAFWINAYNALTIQAVLKTLPEDQSAWPEYSIQDQRVNGESIWKGMRFDVGGGQWSLDGIEHKILREQDGLRDPRIHVALVCAARGCPPLWNRAYTAGNVHDQLASAMRRFVNDTKQCRIDAKNRIIEISQVFNWYKDDFTNPKFSPRADSIPAFLAMSIDDPELSRSLQAGDWQLNFFEYDWKLNLKQSSKP